MARVGDHSDRVFCVRTMAAVLLVDRGGVYGWEKLCRTLVIFFLLSRAIIANLLLVAGGGTRYLARSEQLWLRASDLHKPLVPRFYVEIELFSVVIVWGEVLVRDASITIQLILIS